jgi:hypothetical protein
MEKFASFIFQIHVARCIDQGDKPTHLGGGHFVISAHVVFSSAKRVGSNR